MTLDELITELQEKHNAEWCNLYGEPGYTQPAEGVIFANWNNIEQAHQEMLEAAGYELEWSDEWTIDYDNNKAYRTSPDSYFWEPSVAYTEDGEMLTPDDSPHDWIEAMAVSDPSNKAQCLPSWITPEDLVEAGFVKSSGDMESGFFEGQTDDPKAEAIKLFYQGAIRVVFRKIENSQFYTKWEVWKEME